MSKFTPGPWYIKTHDGVSWVKSDYNPVVRYGTDILCEDHGEHNGYPDEQWMADARLVSKAPEMYDMVKELRNVIIALYDNGEFNLAKIADESLKKSERLLMEIDSE